MKYYRVTALTPYVGEETIDYIATESNKELAHFADELCADNAAEWAPCFDEYAEEGYESAEAWEEDYYSGCYVRIEELTEEEYKEETKPRWPFELVKEGPGWEK